MSTMRLQTEPMVLRIAKAIASYIGFGDDDSIGIEPAITQPVNRIATPEPRMQRMVAKNPDLRLVSTSKETEPETHADHKWRRHPQLRQYEAPISDEIRSARHDAVRGLCAARAGALDVAIRHFAVAAQCDDVDLTAIPGFWNLTRGQMQTAVHAYESVGRHRDAAALDAHIETIFRPSLVGSSRQPIIPAHPRHKAAST